MYCLPVRRSVHLIWTVMSGGKVEDRGVTMCILYLFRSFVLVDTAGGEGAGGRGVGAGGHGGGNEDPVGAVTGVRCFGSFFFLNFAILALCFSTLRL